MTIITKFDQLGNKMAANCANQPLHHLLINAYHTKTGSHWLRIIMQKNKPLISCEFYSAAWLLILGVQYCTLIFIGISDDWLIWLIGVMLLQMKLDSPYRPQHPIDVVIQNIQMVKNSIPKNYCKSFCLFIIQFELLRCASNFVVIERDKRAYLQAHPVSVPIIRSYRHCSSKYFAITVTAKSNHFDGNFFVYGSVYHLRKSRFRFSHT